MACLVSIRTSILCLYKRLFPILWMRILLWLTGAFVLCGGISAIFVTIFQCVPVQALWDPNVAGARWLDFGTSSLAFGFVNVVTDCVILALPMRPVWTLQMSRRSKCVVTAIFVIGCGYIDRLMRQTRNPL